ncbi:hypothetical protein V8E53_005735, partial [Lactarius tabidus]
MSAGGGILVFVGVGVCWPPMDQSLTVIRYAPVLSFVLLCGCFESSLFLFSIRFEPALAGRSYIIPDAPESNSSEIKKKKKKNPSA